MILNCNNFSHWRKWLLGRRGWGAGGGERRRLSKAGGTFQNVTPIPSDTSQDCFGPAPFHPFTRLKVVKRWKKPCPASPASPVQPSLKLRLKGPKCPGRYAKDSICVCTSYGFSLPKEKATNTIFKPFQMKCGSETTKSKPVHCERTVMHSTHIPRAATQGDLK